MQHLFLGSHGTAHAESRADFRLSRFQNSQIQRGLHQSGNILTHGLDAIGRAGQQAQHTGRGRLIHGHLPALCRLHSHSQIGVRHGILPGQCPSQFLSRLLRSLDIRSTYHSGCRRSDGVVLQSAVHRHQPHRRCLRHGPQNPAHQHVRIGTALVNLRAGVSAGQTRNLHL